MADGCAAHAHQGFALPRMDGGRIGHAALRGRQMGGSETEPGHRGRPQAADGTVPDRAEAGGPEGADWGVRGCGTVSHGCRMP
eukprot:15477284-Alexandrium_andersonii.AAC.1